MFGYIKIVLTALIISAIAGAGIYVMKLRSDNAILKANQMQLEQNIKSQQKLLEQQKVDFQDILESNKKLNQLVQAFKKDLDELDKKFNKGNRDIGKLAIEKTQAVERAVNNGSDQAARCIELASGAKRTEAEINATKRSEANLLCPSLANPNFVDYE